MALTTEQKQILWSTPQFKDDLQYCANTIALFILSEPNYGIDYMDPNTWTYAQIKIQERIRNYWQKRFNLANKMAQDPQDANIFRMLFYAVVDGNFEIDSPITFPASTPVYVSWDALDETNGLAGFIKKIWNDLAGVKSNEYPWAGENDAILEPSDPNWYADHFSNLPLRF